MTSLVDLINRCYIQQITRQLGKPVWLISGFQYYPFVGAQNGAISRVLSIVGSGLYPLSLCLLFPIFLYLIVLDKEGRQLEIMKINGLKILSYWTVIFIFSLIITIITFAVFLLVGIFWLKLDFFTQTNINLIVYIFNPMPAPQFQDNISSKIPQPLQFKNGNQWSQKKKKKSKSIILLFNQISPKSLALTPFESG